MARCNFAWHPLVITHLGGPISVELGPRSAFTGGVLVDVHSICLASSRRPLAALGNNNDFAGALKDFDLLLRFKLTFERCVIIPTLPYCFACRLLGC